MEIVDRFVIWLELHVPQLAGIVSAIVSTMFAIWLALKIRPRLERTRVEREETDTSRNEVSLTRQLRGVYTKMVQDLHAELDQVRETLTRSQDDNRILQARLQSLAAELAAREAYARAQEARNDGLQDVIQRLEARILELEAAVQSGAH